MPIKQTAKHNYTDCCRKNNVPRQCLFFCSFDNTLAESEDTPDAPWQCSEHLSPITKCLTDGRDHMPCCVRQNIPEICRSVCRGDYQQLTVLQHYSCSKYALPTLACISEGLELLPGPPKFLTVEPLSSTKLKLKWLPPHQTTKVSHYKINITQLHEFDEDGKLKEDNNRESKELSIDKQDPIITVTVNGTLRDYTVENLHPLTMYEIAAIAQNEHGSSLPTYALRTLTLSSSSDIDHDKPIEKPNVTIPDVRGCCERKGVQLGRCLRILCDPSRADETRMTDIMICAPWANVTFECMAGGFDHSDCCRLRGVPDICLDFCRGTVTRVDYRHFVCLEYMAHYGSCLLEHYGLITGPPQDFLLTTAHTHWAVLQWNPPNILGNTVERYVLHWRNVSNIEDVEYNIIPNVHSPYLLDGLSPGVRYEAYVIAENSFGASQGSSRVVFSTIALPDAPQSAEVRNETGYNETACCVSAGLRDHCIPLCSYEMKMTDLELLAPLCVEDLHTLLRCGAGGRDHTPCCMRRQVPDNCLPFCAGTMSDELYLTAFTCDSHIADIIQCMADGTEVLPQAPQEFQAVTITPQSIQIQWNPPDNGKFTNFQVYYEKVTDKKILHPTNYTNVVNVTSTSTILNNLESDTQYNMYVVALNEHGTSLPSLILSIHTPVSGTKDTVVKGTLSPPHTVDIPYQTVDSITVTWKPPYHVPPDAYLNYIVYYHPANGSFDLVHDGLTFATTFNSVILRNLSVNTEYAIAVRARSGQGESDLSETVMVWTDPAVPALVHAPVIIPAGQILEGLNVTILCIGVGIPVPTTSVFVNGKLMKKEKQRHVAYTLVRIQRNITNVGCYADNGYGYGAQSSQDIRVGFKPTVETITKAVTSTEGGRVRLQCIVHGHPEPRLTWFRDYEKQTVLRSNSKYDTSYSRQSENPSSYIASLLLKNVTKSDAGDYFCKAENRFGSSILGLTLTLKKREALNVSACCIEKGVSEQCLAACAFDIDIQYALSRPHCISEIDKLMMCASDGRDHQQCCRQHKVPRYCMRWCKGFPVIHADLCIYRAASEIISCFEEGKNVLPGLPENVLIKRLSEISIELKWEPPTKNAQFVQWYRIFWRPVGTKELFRNQTRETSFRISDLKPGNTYEIFVKAGNHYGQSQPTNPKVITMSLNESDSTSAIKVAVGIIVTVLILVLIGILIIYFKFKYQPNIEKGVSFENPTYMKENISLQNTGEDRNTTIENSSEQIQKKQENQRAVANIYEEPKSCNGQ
ncbi:Ig-like and fibronectin type-III domain-containing protein 2 [Centruroides sculpturatus]|uniref:Ig-like and fibronectin type-III domain-containing protein 2 n=1 Tax=Centruroides sculpturatus TaxID=218467 RepID=UPI000C6D14A4|nr:Ig-like and fibronectin type-III domain-containing protein 2 [Centruroides sculpturatus]